MTRYYATQDIVISGVENSKGEPLRFKAGDELSGIPATRFPNLLRLGVVREVNEPEPKPPVPVQVPVVQQNKQVEQPRKAGK